MDKIFITLKNKNTGEKKKKFIGTVLYNGAEYCYEFVKNIFPDEHVQHNMQSLAIDAKTFDRHILNICKWIKIYDITNKKLYQTTPQIMKEKGEYKHFIDNKGWDYRTEIFLKCEEFNKELERG